jgi:hypothetical protein
MISQTGQDVGGNAEPQNLLSAVDQEASSGQAESAAGDGLARPTRIASKRVPKTKRIADAQALEAHVERRRRLATLIRVENPSRTEEEIEERLEQFGV